jgi:hypothetical protein
MKISGEPIFNWSFRYIAIKELVRTWDPGLKPLGRDSASATRT